MIPSQDLLHRALASLKDLHTLHGPCDGPTTCPHARVIVEMENALFTEQPPTEPARCPSCGEIVPSIFDHVDGCPGWDVPVTIRKTIGDANDGLGVRWLDEDEQAAQLLRFHENHAAALRQAKGEV